LLQEEAEEEAFVEAVTEAVINAIEEQQEQVDDKSKIVSSRDYIEAEFL
jgi:hypothetical protein